MDDFIREIYIFPRGFNFTDGYEFKVFADPLKYFSLRPIRQS